VYKCVILEDVSKLNDLLSKPILHDSYIHLLITLSVL